MRLLHLVGSAVDDFYADLSRLYAEDCLRATADPSHETVLAHVSPGGCWRFPRDLSRRAIADAEPLPVAAALAHLAELRVELAVPQMFCLPGMTHYRALLDLLEIPYLGNAPDVMALTADKQKAKAVVAAAGVRVPEGELVRRGRRPTLAPPVVVKPVAADNSLGVSYVEDDAALPAAIDAALAHGPAALVERFVPLGRELRCGVLERGDELVCLPLEEYAVDRVAKPVRDAADKIVRRQDGELRLVAKDAEHAWIVDDGDPVLAAVHEAARRCHRALGCRDYSLFDFRVDPEGRPWFLEAGLYCSFAEQSVISVMARAAGTTTKQLFDAAVDTAVARSIRQVT